MITIQIRAGMGNQMFQYALGKSLSKRFRTDLSLDLNFLNDHGIYKKILKEVPRQFDLEFLNIEKFTLSKKTIHNKLFRPLGEMKNRIGKIYNDIYSLIIQQQIIREKKFQYDQDLYDGIGDNSYIIGYRQSYKYFDEISSELRNEFTPKTPLSSQCLRLLNQIQNTESVCLNIRRGDNLTDGLFYLQTKEYYIKGVERIREKLGGRKIHIFVFSDDIDRCKVNLIFPDTEIIFVDKEYAGPKYTHYQELLSHGKHFVGANSSFCWWAIRKNRNKNKIIILPELRFTNPNLSTTDMIPEYRNSILL